MNFWAASISIVLGVAALYYVGEYLDILAMQLPLWWFAGGGIAETARRMTGE